MVKLGEEKEPRGLVSWGDDEGWGGSQRQELPDLDSHPELIYTRNWDSQTSALESEHCILARRGAGERKERQETIAHH